MSISIHPPTTLVGENSLYFKTQEYKEFTQLYPHTLQYTKLQLREVQTHTLSHLAYTAKVNKKIYTIKT